MAHRGNVDNGPMALGNPGYKNLNFQFSGSNFNFKFDVILNLICEIYVKSNSYFNLVKLKIEF